jgi:hypothetical protein
MDTSGPLTSLSFLLRYTSVAHCKPMLTMGECVSAYLTVGTVPTVPPLTAHS